MRNRPAERRVLAIAAIFAAALCACAGDDDSDTSSHTPAASSWPVGEEFRGTPHQRGMTFVGQDTLQTATGVYSINNVEDTAGSMLWLARARDGKIDSGISVVVAVQRLGHLGDTSRVWLSTCRFRGKRDNRIAAVVRYEDLRVLSHVLRAFHVSPDSDFIREIDTTGVDCINTDGGE